GRIVITTLVLRQREGGPDITSAVLRDLPLQRLLEHAVQAGVLGGVMRRTASGDYESVDPAEFAQLDEAEQAAITYRVAFARGLQPTNAVARQLGISPTAAGKRIERLRQAGRLEATSPGRKGV